MTKKTNKRTTAMPDHKQYKAVVSGIRRIHRIACRLSRLPEKKLSVDMDTALDVDYINEWLDIILCRICGQQAVSMPSLSENFSPQQLYLYCMKKARKQAGCIRWGLFTGRISQQLVTADMWAGVDSALLMMNSVAAEQRRWH